VVDILGQSATATVEILVQSPLDVAPTPGADSVTISEDGGVASGNLLSNDTDPDALPGDAPLHAVAETVTSTLGAHITIAANGVFTYDASAVAAVQALGEGETTTDDFSYRVDDGFGGVTTGTV